MSNISIRVNQNDKTLFEDFCESVGLNVSTALNMFIKNVVKNQKLPFAVERDYAGLNNISDTLIKRITDIDNGKAKLLEHELIEV